ncbi:YdgH/BhsA/McbA-like domain containing protein [Franconibacter pulveris]|uniref:YdgH/BhsA/McbA-like domain containing protein n=1 Tax=Franconibacter pulveris TaxID=435910 RepID=UPI000497D721|nr:YdgH/BhsA/McbA-like domain containing protein [Franconibacter pulveris]
MKIITGVTTALFIGSVSFGALAAEEIQKEKVKEMNLTKIGTIVTDDATAPMDAKQDLSKKADAMGGKYYVVISAQKPGQDIHATADVYK